MKKHYKGGCITQMFTLSTTEWKPINGFEGHYWINRHGDVRSSHPKKKGKLLKPWVGTDGYARVDLYYNSKRRRCRVNRLVAETFIPNPDNKCDVNHIDNNPLNNDVSNLEWVTRSENMMWAVKFDRQHVKKIPIIAQNIATGETVLFESTQDAMRHGFIQSAVWRCIHGFVKQHRGYTFKRA